MNDKFDLKQFITQSCNFHRSFLSLISVCDWLLIDNILIFIEGFPSMCTCCPISKSSSSASTSTTCSTATNDTTTTPSSTAGNLNTASNQPIVASDARTSSVAELRRKAQEHSAALLHSLHAVAVSGLSFPGLHFPPLSLQKFSDHYALTTNRSKNGHHHFASDYISDLSLQHNNNNNIISKHEPNEKIESDLCSTKNNSD